MGGPFEQNMDEIKKRLAKIQRDVHSFAENFRKPEIPEIVIPKVKLNIDLPDKRQLVQFWFENSIFIYIRSLREYAKVTENFIITQEKPVEQFLPDDEKNYHILSEEFSHFLRSSFVVTCFSLVEHRLNALCGILYQLKNLEQNWTDYKEKTEGIERAKSYLRKEAKLENSFQSPFWLTIRKYERVRNIIVHNDGCLDENDTRNNGVRDFLEEKKRKTGSVYLGKMGYIEIEKEFAFEVLNTLEDFFSALYSEVVNSLN